MYAIFEYVLMTHTKSYKIIGGCVLKL